MKQLLEEVREMLHLVTQAAYFYRKQDYIKGNMYTIRLTRHGEIFFNYAEEKGFNESVRFLLPIWKELLNTGNETALADAYENQLVPALFEIQSCLFNELDSGSLIYWEDNMDILKDTDNELYKILSESIENEEREYILSFAYTGDAVLSVETEQYGQVPLSSFVNPWQEAVIYGDKESGHTGRCVIIGLGMGYHINYIVSSSYYKEIIVIESDLEQLRICMMYIDMRTVLSDKRVKIVLCNKAEDYSKWFKKSSQDNTTEYRIWYPSVKTIEDNAIRELLENYWVNTNSMENLSNVMLYNFESNQKLNDEPVDNIKDKFKGKDVLIIGAGPSVDEELDYLRKFLNRDNVVIICVGKIAKKLISENIMPGYIVAIDAKKGTRWQTKGIENCGIPLIYLSTAAHNLVSEYNGKRYIAYQEGIEASMEFAKENNLAVYQSGGSVATFVIDMLIRMECMRVICVGLDMGYIGNSTHAKGIGGKIQDKTGLRKVESVAGSKIYTSKTLDIYRRWIERRIENVKNIEFINSSGGARIHGMKEKSLKEITEDYSKQTIYCYVEEQGEELDKFIKNNSSDSLINIYYSVIEECEGKLIYCLCDIADRYMKSDKKLWFATDIKSLYNIVEKLYPFIFEKIIYIEQRNNKDFQDGIEIKKLINYFIRLQKNKLHASLAEKLYSLKNSTNLDEFIRYLDKLEDSVTEQETKLTGFWCCFCQIILYEIEQETSYSNYFNYKLALYSILMKIGKSADYVNLYLSEVLDSSSSNAGNKYFVYHQFKRMLFTREVKSNNETGTLVNGLYVSCYKEFFDELKDNFIKIPSIERNRNLVMIMTVQFLGEEHAPTQTIMERIKILKLSGKSVVLVNTAELNLLNGYLPLYGINFGNVFEEYNELNEFKIDKYKVPFLQIPEDLPIQYRMQVLIHLINKIKPYYILSIGNGSILADLCGNIVPCASMSVVFSSIPKTKNNMKIIGRKLKEDEKKLYIDDDIIESRFTFELKEQKLHYSKMDKNLPDNKFILVVVGTRLQFDVTDEFMKMLQEVCQKGCYVVFAGIMDNYDNLMENYPVVSANSSFIGYCDDILALMEICDLYVNPDRIGGGFSIIEAFSKGKPGVYLKSGDVYTAGGDSFAVNNFDEMAKQILRYKNDKDYYKNMSGLAKERAKLMTSSKEAIEDIDRQICQRIEERYW